MCLSDPTYQTLLAQKKKVNSGQYTNSNTILEGYME